MIIIIMGVMNIEALTDKTKDIANIMRVSNSHKGTLKLLEKELLATIFFSKGGPRTVGQYCQLYLWIKNLKSFIFAPPLSRLWIHT